VPTFCDTDADSHDVEQVPVGSASIGQAHTACTVDGQEVCVKVQYPDARWQFMADIDCLRLLTHWTQPTSLPAFEEFARQYVSA
jgi:predicted unusual protein kinase regulating ubiquinone biosynthesis (AarF/ABC1/UbiB family)